MSRLHNSSEDYLSKLERLAEGNKRYLWLIQYLHQDQYFLHNCLAPITQGSTRTILADFPSKATKDPSIRTFDGLEDNDKLNHALQTRPPEVSVRLIHVSCTSGVDHDVRKRVSK